jgi:hypothetical protein
MKLIKICAYDSGVRRDDGRKNEFSALIIAKMAAKMCEFYSCKSLEPWFNVL